MNTSPCTRLLVTSGDGPRECRRAVFLLLRRMAEEARKSGLLFEAETPENSETADVSSALITLTGQDAAHFAGQWIGTVQWICKSPFRPRHRRQNWFVGVFPLSDAPELQVDLSPQALKVETFRSGGPGGQHQNTTDSGVRITHLATGISAISTDERSQHRNRQRALERLNDRFLLLAQEAAASDRANRNRLHGGLERGNPRRVFTGPGFAEKK